MPKTKLTIQDIKAIFYFRKMGLTLAEIGKLFKVTKSHVSRIIRNLRWKKIQN